MTITLLQGASGKEQRLTEELPAPPGSVSVPLRVLYARLPDGVSMLLDQLECAPLVVAVLDAESSAPAAPVCRCSGYWRYRETIRSVAMAKRGACDG
jgi:hypothetical protein